MLAFIHCLFVYLVFLRWLDLKDVFTCFSAGVGRTGAFIMIDALLEQAKKEGCVDVFGYMKSIRKDRPNMVQTEVSFCQFLNKNV